MITHYPMATPTANETIELVVTEIVPSILYDVRVWIAVAVILAIYWWIRTSWRN